MKEVKSVSERIKWIAAKQKEIVQLEAEGNVIYNLINNGEFRIMLSEYSSTTITPEIMRDIYQNIIDKIQAITDEVAEYLTEEIE